MRQLNKSDKSKSEVHVKECGARVKRAFHKLAWWDVTLAKTAADFFGSTAAPPTTLDGATPILLLVARTDVT